MSVISPLGDPQPHLTCLAHIVSLEPLARPAARARQWLPDFRIAGGRAAVLPGACWLGPFFNIRCGSRRGIGGCVVGGRTALVLR